MAKRTHIKAPTEPPTHTSAMASQRDTVFRLAPFSYIHVLDVTTNITRMETGPQTFIRQENENVVEGPTPMVAIPARHYATVANPVLRDDDGNVVFEIVADQPQTKLRHGEKEIRLAQDPFGLYPGEIILGGINKLTVVASDSALRLRAVLDWTDPASGKKYVTGDEWLFQGPATYTPAVEVVAVNTVSASVISANQALVLQAAKELTDHKGNRRVMGERWLVLDQGAYLPGVFEIVCDFKEAIVLTDNRAIQLEAVKNFKDVYGVVRKTGDEWLVTNSMAETHIPDIHEVVTCEIAITTLSNREYCVVLDPCDQLGKPQLGQRKLVTGPVSFFLRPGERLEEGALGSGVQALYVLGENEGLILRAQEGFEEEEIAGKGNFVASGTDLKKVTRTPGDRWMIRGPTEYIPRVEVVVVEKRQAIPLDDNEGVYVRNNRTGKVRTVIGETYMLNENESLWEKDLGRDVDALIARAMDNGGKGYTRVKSHVVAYRVPHNAAVQLYDYTTKKARVVFGPELVMLGPDEQFTRLSLSGSEWKRDPKTGVETPGPKRPGMIKSLYLELGPAFCCDVITIETADHARLQLQLAYNWKFENEARSDANAAKLFSVSDFVGDLCKAVASRIRGAVAGVQFDDFHKNSAKIIRGSVFGQNEAGKVGDAFNFPANGLVITSIDIQNVEPVDQRTRDALQKSVQLAIEITTNSQEATATHEAQRLQQEAMGRLERQRISDEAQNEEARTALLLLQANSSAVESTGQAKAEAQSRAEAARIEGQAAVEQAKLQAEAMQIESEAELKRLQAARVAELDYITAQNALLLDKMAKTADVEKAKFASMVEAIGQDTLHAIAVSGPETQAKLLGSLGIKSTLITDGKSPINLFQTATGLLGMPQHGANASDPAESC